jgi:acetylornithine deacetylase/succinyl-diaminopimelate desuccinylase-like protein
MTVDPIALAHSVAELVRIPSVHPFQFGPKAAEYGEVGELAVAQHLAKRFEELGASEVVLDEAAPGRPNVYGFVPGRTDRVVVVDVHIDTVGVEHMTDPPFDGRIEDGCVWGRGSLDTKATMGIMLTLVDQWRAAGVRPDPTVLLVGSVSEEAGGLLGATRFRPWVEERGIQIDQMIVAEPTELAPIHGHKGLVIMEITTVGKAAHSALPQLGENAIEAMVPVIAALQGEHARLQTLTPPTELGNGTLSVTTINGGTGGNVIPAHCTIVASRRLVPGEDPNTIFEQMVDLARAASPLPVTVESLLPVDPDGTMGSRAFYQTADSDFLRLLAGHAGTQPKVAPFGTNALRYNGFANELAVFGPGSIDDAHQATECVAISELVRAANVLTAWLDPA